METTGQKTLVRDGIDSPPADVRGKGHGSMKSIIEVSSLSVLEDGDDISKNRDDRGEKRQLGRKMP